VQPHKMNEKYAVAFSVKQRYKMSLANKAPDSGLSRLSHNRVTRTMDPVVSSQTACIDHAVPLIMLYHCRPPRVRTHIHARQSHESLYTNAS